MSRRPLREQICLGFDGSETEDWSAIRAETLEGYQFTPTFGPDKIPTIWDPAQYGGRIPRLDVHAAVDHLFTFYDVVRFYYDPPKWQSEGEAWSLKFGEEIVLPFETYQIKKMHAALERFVIDLTTGALTHDGCPITSRHIANARKVPKPGEKYLLGKPVGAYHQKIDAAVTSVIVHEAACDARAAGWKPRRSSKMTVIS